MPTLKYHDNAPDWDKGDSVDKWLPDKATIMSKLKAEKHTEYVGYLCKWNSELSLKLVEKHKSYRDDTEEWVESHEIIGAYEEMIPILTNMMNASAESAEAVERYMPEYEKWQQILKQRLEDHRGPTGQ